VFSLKLAKAKLKILPSSQTMYHKNITTIGSHTEIPLINKTNIHLATYIKRPGQEKYMEK
jgi:hypothetical protein